MTNACPELRWLLAGLLALGGCAQRPPAPLPAGEHGIPHPVRQAFQQAVEALHQGRLEQAVAELRQLTARHPRLAAAWYDLGLARLGLGEDQAAREALERAAELRPGDARIHNALGVALRRLGRLEEARAAYLQALDLDPNLASAHRNLGILLDLYLDRPAEARDHYLHYRRLAPAARGEVDRWLQELDRRLPRQAHVEGSEP